MIPAYAADIKEWFGPYKNHPVADYLWTLKRYGMGYDAIAAVGYALELKNGKFVLQSRYKSASEVGVGGRWGDKGLKKYIRLLNDFYKKSNFQDFFDNHASVYAAQTDGMDMFLGERINCKWFEEFYGVPFGTPDIYMSMVNAPHSYGLVTPWEDFGILISCVVDKNGDPAYNDNTYMVVVHEIQHKFTIPLAFARSEQFAAATDRLPDPVLRKLAGRAYPKAAIVSEWLTRLATLIYLRDNAPRQVAGAIEIDTDNGFVWQRQAYDFTVAEFCANRDKYPFFGDFVPRLVEWFGVLDMTS